MFPSQMQISPEPRTRQPEPMVARETPTVQLAMQRLQELLSQIDVVSNDLFDLLNPVLRKEGPHQAQVTPVRTLSGCDLGEAIYTIANRIDSHVLNLMSIRDRIDI